MVLLIKVWFMDRQHLGASEKTRLSGPTPDLPHQNLDFNKVPQVSAMHIKVWEALIYGTNKIFLNVTSFVFQSRARVWVGRTGAI